MIFNIDKQSLDELNLMGKFRQGSVYHLFNQVRTRGGEKLLDTMFKNPLPDPDQINSRTAVFHFFQSANLSFPFDPNQLSLMQEYVDSGNEQGRIVSYLDTLIKKSLSGLTRDERYKKTIQGLQATIIVLKKCYGFVERADLMSGAYKKRVNGIKEVFQNEQLMQLVNTDIYKSISLRRIAEYDYLVRGKLNSAIQDILSFTAEIDVNIAVSNVAKARDFTYAQAVPKITNTLQAKELRHPCIDHAVGNDLEMQGDSNVIFLTGANMAGKSTFLRAVSTAVYMAHMGFPVAAAGMEFSVMDGIYTTVNLPDNLGIGASHFYAEVLRVKKIATELNQGRSLFIVFDELFRGTNVKDAYEATVAITHAFALKKTSLFIISSHIVEAGEALKQRNNIGFFYLPTRMNGHNPTYTYTLEQGITDDRHGMIIIRNEGILDTLEAGLRTS